MYRNLAAELARAGLKTGEVSNYMGISRQCFNDKKMGKTSWTLGQMELIQDLINEKLSTEYTLDYLFKKGD